MLPSEGQMLYIFLYIDSTQGGWGQGMGNKSDKVAPFSVPFALTFPFSVPSLAQASFFALSICLLFFLFSPSISDCSALSAFALHCLNEDTLCTACWEAYVTTGQMF